VQNECQDIKTCLYLETDKKSKNLNVGGEEVIGAGGGQTRLKERGEGGGT